jgi:hypothetical protein
MAIKFNVEPYYDDFETPTAVDGLSPREKYHRILFRPGHAVQARELTQIQSMLQHQVSSVGRHLFEEGSLVIPGHVSVENRMDCVKMDANGINVTDPDDLIGLTFTGDDTGIQAKVVAVAAATALDPLSLFVKYLKSGTDGANSKVFDDAEVITSGSYTGTTATSDATTFGSVAFIEEGIYFINNQFVVVQADQLVLDKYSTNPSYDVGLVVTESIQSSAGDASLNDNATGSPNYAAPGAHRYQIKTQLQKDTVNGDTYENFLLLARIEDGEVAKLVRETDYSVLEETLARRTFDESGNYTVRPFNAILREYNDVRSPLTDATKLTLGLEPGKAYVRGYEIETLSTKLVDVDKARETDLFNSVSVPMLIGNYITVSNVTGMPDIRGFGLCNLWDNTAANQSSPNNIIGFARIRSIVYAGGGEYRLYLFAIEMNSGSVFEDVKSIQCDMSTVGITGRPDFTADLELDSSNRAIVQEPQRNSLVFPLPFDRVSTCDGELDPEEDPAFDYDYFLNKDMGTGGSAVTSGSVTWNTSGSTEQFEPFDDENWLVTVTATGVGTDPSVDIGDVISLSSGNVTISNVNQTATITFNSIYEDATVSLIAGVKRSTTHKTKTIPASPGEVNITSPTGDDILDHSDGYRLIGVWDSEDTGTNATTSDVNVTEYYDFDNGQRDNFYGACRLKLKPNTSFRPKGRLFVQYDYFEHAGAGDYFTVDSYTNITDSDGNPLDYTDIPTFTSKVTGLEIELASAIDFRPQVDGNSSNFDAATASTCPEPLTTFSTDVQYYLNRRDKVYLDKNGNFGIVKGVPSLSPEEPEDPKDAMILYKLFVPAYTASPSEVAIDLIDNKRYTMRDIGKLEKRINRLEYYTSLSLLEKEAADKQLIDNDGTNRQKSGFIVDSFVSHAVGNVTSKEFKAAIDRDGRALRPLFSEDNVRLVYDSANSSGDVQKTGPLVTLSYTEDEFYFQKHASNTINVNPYDVFEWTGTLELSPSSDEWKDTTRRPEVIIDQEGVYDAMVGIINETDALGTVWNEWTTSWTGQEILRDPEVIRFGNGSRRGWGNRVQTTVISDFDIGQTRSGIETAIVPDTVRTNVGDRVVEINFAPFIRSRKIYFKGTRLKPNTNVYVRFDNIDVTNYVRTESSFDVFEDLDETTNAPIPGGQNTITEHPDGASTLKTDASGQVIGSFYIPNNAALNFRTGTRILKISDSSTNDEAEITTKAEAAYNAKGLIETKENVTISTRVPLIERREVTDNRTIQDSRVVSRNTDWYDPLAQSFMIDLEGGAFLTSIDIFFHKASSTIPITLQIREMRQGLPTQTIVPFSEVTLRPDTDTINVVDLTTELPDPSTPTKFTFPAPVYLQQGQEYCFVLMANTNEYEVWYAGIGETNDVNNTDVSGRISKQPYAGVLFKSQNASTWTADQNSDLKFTLNRAVFDIDGTSNKVRMKNGIVQDRYLSKNPFVTESGSNVVRVYHPNHHMFNETAGTSSSVVISGVGAAVNGIPASEFNATHVVANVEMDWYEITLTTNATDDGVGGGTTVIASENQLYSTFYPFVQNFNLPGTNTTWNAKVATGVSLVERDSPVAPYGLSTWTPIIINRNTSVDSVKVIASDINDPGSGTFLLEGTLSSNRDNISPVIDLERCSVITVANRIDNSASTVTDGFNVVDGFTAETDPSDGSALAKYITKNVKLAEAADGVRLYLDVSRPSQTFVDVYYRVSDSDDTIDSNNWVLATPDESIPFNDAGNYNETVYEIDPPGIFTVFALKIVMRSREQARVPTIKNLRAIAVLP